MRKLLAVFILVFFAVIVVGGLGLLIYWCPQLLIIVAALIAPFSIFWAIEELQSPNAWRRK